MTILINNIIKSYKHIPYTFKHYIAFLKMEKKLLGYYKYKFHDLDKLILYIFVPFLGTKKIKKIHSNRNKHHINEKKDFDECNYEEAIIDWECSRFTKPDKPLNARQVTLKHHSKSKHFRKLLNTLNKLGL